MRRDVLKVRAITTAAAHCFLPTKRIELTLQNERIVKGGNNSFRTVAEDELLLPLASQ
jgi:hypothetical protein